eukprot:7381201-Prymnesium_polylepis.5
MGAFPRRISFRGRCPLLRIARVNPNLAVCTLEGSHFDSDVAKCTECPEPGVAAGVMVAALLVTLGAIVGLSILYQRPADAPKGALSTARDALHLVVDTLAILGPTKPKMLVGFYQIIIAIENTYNVDPIPDNYISALVPFQFLSFDWSALVYPSSCLSGGFKARLLLVCIGPLLFMLGLAILPIVGALVSALVVPVMAEVSATIKRTTSSVRSPGRKTSRRSLASSQLSLGMAVLFGWIPFVLLVIFSFLPAVTNTIFATWSCDRFEASAGESVYFMNRDLSVQCDTDEHDQIKAVAWYMIAIWYVQHTAPAA